MIIGLLSKILVIACIINAIIASNLPSLFGWLTALLLMFIIDSYRKMINIYKGMIDGYRKMNN